MDISDRRGRPKKDPEERRSITDTIKLRPSREKILRQEAERCEAPMSRVLRGNGFEKIRAAGRRVPSPVVLDWLLKFSKQISQKADTLEAKWLLEELKDLRSELKVKRVEVQRRLDKRERYRDEAKGEKCTEQLSIRLTPKELEWLEEEAETREVPMRTLLREAAFEKISEREQMREINDQLAGWEATVILIRNREDGRGGKPENEDRMRGSMKNVGLRISRFVKEETNWG